MTSKRTQAAAPAHSTQSSVLVRGLALCALALLALSAFVAPVNSQAQRAEDEQLPPGTRVETVLPNMNRPVAMVFDPVGRLFYTEKSGAVRLWANGQLQPNPVITFRVNSEFERGLLGIALDPNFNTNRFVYVYYTNDQSNRDDPARENRVARFVERDGVGSAPTTIFTSPQTAGNHVGGNIHFGPDGKLYVTVGDNAQANTGQDVTSKNAKIHRLNPDGSAPADNPRFEGEGALPTLYAMGLRNSFDFTFDPIVAGRIFASENGPGCDDEMNRIEAGGNYGWRGNYPCDGANADPRFNTIKPLWFLGSGNCCLAPTGITVYTGHQIPQWRNHLFMGNYNGGALYHFVLNADRTAVVSTFEVQGVTANMDVLTGPDGAFYFIEGGGYQSGTLKRIVGPGQAPGGSPTATPRPGSTPGPAPTIPGTGSQTFPETGVTVRGIFFDYWRSNGGLMQQGFPISELMPEVSDLNGRPYTVQYFERAVFEHHPENQPPFNVLLSQLGTFQQRAKYPNGPPNQKPNTQPGSQRFAETGKRVGGRFLEYWRQNGGLAQQGFPISDEFEEKSDLNGQTYIVQYFERAVFEYHPENRAPFDVLLSQLGTFRYRAKYPTSGGNNASAAVLTDAGSMSIARANHSAILLPDGKVLIAGGMERDGVLTASAELFDPSTGAFEATGNLTEQRVGHTATLLPNGKVLLVGGFGPGPLSSAELYDPVTGRFACTGSMSTTRGGFTATLLPSGKVLIAGGFDGNRHSGAELYDPATGNFTPTGSMNNARSAHAATLLPDGKVLVTGGDTARSSVLASAELYDPATGSFGLAGNMSVARYKHAATLLADGKVLIVGGSDSRDWRGRYASAEIYNPVNNSFTATGSMSVARFKLSDAVATLQDGNVLVAGGGERVEVYNAALGGFNTARGEMDDERFYQTATRLPDGKILVTGGYDIAISPSAKAWVYMP